VAAARGLGKKSLKFKRQGLDNQPTGSTADVARRMQQVPGSGWTGRQIAMQQPDVHWQLEYRLTRAAPPPSPAVADQGAAEFAAVLEVDAGDCNAGIC
jgi:hypothetical protein